MRKRHLLAITLLLLLSLTAFEPSVAQPSQITVKVTDDTHVDSANPDTPLGAQKYLDIENYGGVVTSYHQMIWLKFSLSNVPQGAEVDQATLKVYAWFIDGTLNVTAHYCPDNSWTESTLTYSNMPSYDPNPIDTTSVSKDEEWYSWNVVEAVRGALNSNTQNVTIVLTEPMLSTQNSVYMYSKETPSLVMDVSPTLTLSWSSIILTTSPPTATPSPALATPSPTSTVTATPTTTSGEPTNWAIWGVLLAIILVIVFLSVYILARRKRSLPPPPPPPPP